MTACDPVLCPSCQNFRGIVDECASGYYEYYLENNCRAGVKELAVISCIDYKPIAKNEHAATFSDSPEDQERARQLIAALEKNMREHRGVTTYTMHDWGDKIGITWKELTGTNDPEIRELAREPEPEKRGCKTCAEFLFVGGEDLIYCHKMVTGHDDRAETCGHYEKKKKRAGP